MELDAYLEAFWNDSLSALMQELYLTCYLAW